MKFFKKVFTIVLSLALSFSCALGSYVNVSADEIHSEETYFTSHHVDADGSSVEETFWRSLSSKFYYNQLDDKNKSFYDRLDAAFMKYLLNDQDVQSFTVKYSDLGLADYDADIPEMLFFFANPQYFFSNGSFLNKDGIATCNIASDFTSGTARAAAKAKIKTELNKYIELANSYTKAEDKEHAVFLRICENLSPNSNASLQTLAGIADENAYTTTYMYLFAAVMNAIGNNCVSMAGRNNGWNAVCIHGFWYFVDVYNCDYYASSPTCGQYWLYNQNYAAVDPYPLFKTYQPEVKFDAIEADTHSSRYFSDSEHTYFIVSDYSGTGFYASPISGSFDTCPSTITHDGRTYQIIKAPTQQEPYIPSETDVKIDENNFPDPVFRQYVKDWFDDGNGYLSEEERNEVWYIEIDHTELADLTGLAFFPELATLLVNYNKLNTIDLSKNTKISQLQCLGNNITSLDISKVTYFAQSFKNDDFFKYRDKTNGYMKYQSADGERQISLLTDVTVKLICDGVVYDPLTDPELNALDEPIVDPSPTVPSAAEKAFWKSMSSDYYYRQMTKNEKKLYDRLDSAAMDRLFNNKTSYGNITADASDLGLSSSEVYHVAYIFRMSNPQYFFLDSAFAYSSGGVGICIANCGKGKDRLEAREMIKKEVKEYLTATSACSRPEEKQKVIVDLMSKKITYEHNFDDQTMYGAIKGKCVCAGYMLTFSALMNALGITCGCITTYEHGYNFVNLHGIWYYTDVTFCDGDEYSGNNYSSYNTNIAMPGVDSFLEKYLPEVKYDGLATSTYSKRYFTSGGVTYFIVNEPSKGNGLALPVEGPTNSLPSTVKYNKRTYSVMKTLPDATEYKITLKDPVNGLANVSKGLAHYGEAITVSFTPYQGYDMDEILVNGAPITGTEFLMPDKDIEVEVTFVKHNLTEVPQKDPTCTEPGQEKYYECEKCHKMFSDPSGMNEIEAPVVIEATGHNHILHDGKAPTCSIDGTEPYYECDRCHKLFSDALCEHEIIEPVAIPKLGHKWDDGTQTKDPTCEAEGEKTFKCTRDGCNETKTEPVKALGHKLIKHEEKAPTKTEPGNYEYYECERCGKLFSDSEGKTVIKLEDTVIPVMTHDLTLIKAKAATCTEAGNKAYYECKDENCSCKKLFSDKYGQHEIIIGDTVIPATGHHPEEVAGKEAGCTEPGISKHWKCPDCGKLFKDADGKEEIDEKDTVIPASGHDTDHVDHVERLEPTRDNDGHIEHYICPKCKKLFKEPECINELNAVDVIIPAIGAAVLGEESPVDDLIFKVTNPKTDGSGTVTLIGVQNQAESVTIPATVVIKETTYKVNRIGVNAFNGDNTIKTLVIGKNVQIIDANAFYGCPNLVKVSGGAGLKTIGSYAFARCTKLSSFTLSSKVLSKIGTYAFSKDSKLKTIKIKSTTKLTKKGVKKSLKSSKVKTVKVKKSKVKKYRRYFTKKNCGRKVRVKK